MHSRSGVIQLHSSTPSPEQHLKILRDTDLDIFWDSGHEDWKFDRDMETQMVGTVKPYTRQVKRLFSGVL